LRGREGLGCRRGGRCGDRRPKGCGADAQHDSPTTHQAFPLGPVPPVDSPGLVQVRGLTGEQARVKMAVSASPERGGWGNRRFALRDRRVGRLVGMWTGTTPTGPWPSSDAERGDRPGDAGGVAAAGAVATEVWTCVGGEGVGDPDAGAACTRRHTGGVAAVSARLASQPWDRLGGAGPCLPRGASRRSTADVGAIAGLLAVRRR
jgi:hypothetical protein